MLDIKELFRETVYQNQEDMDGLKEALGNMVETVGKLINFGAVIDSEGLERLDLEVTSGNYEGDAEQLENDLYEQIEAITVEG